MTIELHVKILTVEIHVKILTVEIHVQILTVEIHVQLLTVEIHVQILTVEIHVKITYSQKKNLQSSVFMSFNRYMVYCQVCLSQDNERFCYIFLKGLN